MDDAALEVGNGGGGESNEGVKKRPSESDVSSGANKKTRVANSFTSSSSTTSIGELDKLQVHRTQSSRLDDAAIEAAVAVAVQLTCNSASAEQILQVCVICLCRWQRVILLHAMVWCMLC